MKIGDYYRYSWFSDLAYVDWRATAVGPAGKSDHAIEDANAAERIPGKTSSGDTLIDTLGERIFQPADVGSGDLKGLGWQITAFHANEETDSGFAGSLFENPNTHEKVLALRGTEPGIDDLALADLRDIVKLGVAVEQAVAMVNWINRLRAPNDADVTVVSLPSDRALATLSALPASLAGPGLLALIGGLRRDVLPQAGVGVLHPGDEVTVTGHSLGGHLANIAIRLFPTLFRQSVTFNAPGFDTPMGVGISETFFSALKAVGLTPDAAASFWGLGIHNLQGDGSAPGDDLDVIADLGTLPGDQQRALIEVSTHSMDELVTTLGVHSLLATLLGDGTSFARTNPLIAAASPQEANTDERLVDLLTDLLMPGKAQGPLPVSAGSHFINAPKFATRTPLHARLLALQSFVENNPGTRLRSLVDMTAPDLAGLARQSGAQGLPYRYALQQGIPFAITGRDDAATAALYAPHNGNHELDLFDPASRAGLSHTYLEDRARMLAQSIRRNLADSTLVAGGPYRNEEYDDLARNLRFATADVAYFGPGRAPLARQYVFGTAKGDTLMGGARSDHLYGMAGNDVLEGKGGNDYLEGGPGKDRYRFDASAGLDTLFDSDGKGQIEIEGKTLNGGLKVAEGLWQSADGKHHYVLDGDTLYIDERLRVEHFRNGDLGIKLSKSAAPKPKGTPLGGTAESEVLWWEDLQVGSPKTRHELPVQASGAQGNDLLLTANGDDWIDGGDGNDWMVSGAGNDLLEGGSGNDLLFPAQGSDTAVTGDGDDLVIDTSYRLFSASHSADQNRQIWHDLDGAIERLTTRLYTDRDGEISVDYTLEVPQQRLDGIAGQSKFHYEPKNVAHGTITYEDPSGSTRRYALSHNIFPSADDAPNRFFGGKGADCLAGNIGPDLLSGGPGDDWLLGGAGEDILLGGPGTDKAVGQQGDDLLDGGEGDDELYGGSGQDTLHGGAGDDTLVGDNNLEDEGDSDTLFGGAGSDMLAGNGGDDRLDGGSGHDALWGHDGNDLLQGRSGNDTLHGGAGDDRLFGGSGQRDWLYGEAGDDWLNGGQGQDQLDGGPGEDRLDGGADGVTDWLTGGDGNDRFVFHSNSGKDIIKDGTDGDRVILPDLTPDEISIQTGRSTQGDDLLILRVDKDNALIIKDGISGGPDSYVFGDDNKLSRDALLARRATPLTYQLDEAGDLSGGRAADTLSGSMGSDRILGHGGDDTLAGGGGDDYLAGGEGHDRYLVGPGTGQDTIDEADGQASTLELLPGVDLAQLVYQRVGDDLRIELPGGRDNATLAGFFTRDPVWSVRDAAGHEKLITPAGISAQLQPIDTGLTLTDIRSNFARSVRVDYGNLLRLQGYQQGLDGKWHGTFDSGNTPLERATHHDRYTVAFHTVTPVQPQGDYVRNLPAIDTRLTGETLVSQPATVTSYAPGGVLVAGSTNSGGFVDLTALAQSGAAGIGFSGNALPVYGENPQYNPLTGQLEAPVTGYMLYPKGGGSVGSTTSIRTHTYRDFETQVNLLDLTLGSGDDRFEARDPSYNLVDGGAGDDWLDASAGYERWSRQFSSTRLLPGSLLYGNTGDDHLIGSDNEDELIGGTGNDYLQGGLGGDTYRVDLQGMDRVFEDGQRSSGSDRLVLPKGITPDKVSYQWGTALARNLDPADNWAGRMTSLHTTVSLSWGAGDGVTLVLPHSDQNAGLGIESVIFGDGQALALSQLLQQAGFAETQDPHLADNDLRGGNFLHGYAGDDRLTAVPLGKPIQIGWSRPYDAVLIGGTGHDILNGSSGNDLLLGGDLVEDFGADRLQAAGTLWDDGNTFDGAGGDDDIWTSAGNDTLLFGVGDGNDSVRDGLHTFGAQWQPNTPLDPANLTAEQRHALDNGHDRVRFDAGITPADIEVRRGPGRDAVSDALILAHRNGNDSISFEHWFDVGRNQLDRVEFSDGYFWDRADLDALLRGDPANQAPVAKGALGQLPGAVAGSPLQIALPDHFTDPEGMPLSYSVQQANSQGLPDWLSFDTATRTLRGTPPPDARGVLDLVLVARDDRDKAATTAFQLDIAAPPGGAVGNPGPAGPPIGQPAPPNPPPANPVGAGPVSGVPAGSSGPAGNAHAPDPVPASGAPPGSDLPAPAFAQPQPRSESAIGLASPAKGAARAGRQPLASRLAGLARHGFFVGSHPADDRAALTSAESPLADAASGVLAAQGIAARWQRLQQALEALNDQWQDPGNQDRGIALGAAVPRASPLPSNASPALAASANAPIGLSNASLSRFQGLAEGFRAQTL